MKVRYIFAAQFCGCENVVVEIPDGLSNEEIKSYGEREECLNMPWDENCYYEILED